VKVLLARLEQILNDGASRSQVLPQHDCGHHQVVAVFGLVDVDMASGHGMLLRLDRGRPRSGAALTASTTTFTTIAVKEGHRT
jgi:hypothetical protein